ncbi:MAG: heavy metal-transporting P-type ATPase [Candidatus Saccharibacteria bacterium]|nr:heavy metal-transporting P-type ATPase [Candidatus Saccharibacteria bacterium]
MQKISHFLRQYKMFSLALITGLIGLGLRLNDYDTAARWVVSIMAILEALPLLWDMIQEVRAGKYGIDILAVTAIVASVILGQYWAAIVVVIMLTGGESLEDYAEHRAKRELNSLLERAPQKAHLVRNRKTSDVAVSRLAVGDRVLIKPGELVPADGVIIEGSASFDESSITGESLPIGRDAGDQLVSGSINLDGAVTIKVSATAENSQYQQIVRLVRSAAASQAPFVRLAERYSVPFTFAAYAIAVAVWVYTGEAVRFLDVIIVATPCPLLLAAPIALVSGMSRASKHGVLVKSGSALEKLAEAQTIAFDKTGTLTSGTLSVESITAFNGRKEADVVALAASLEQSSNHVVAHAITNYAVDTGVKAAKAKHITEISGKGLSTNLHGKTVLVGRYSLLEEHGVTMPANFKTASIKHTAVYVSEGDQLVGIITFADAVRDNSAETLQQLQRLGIKHSLLVTGDNELTARAVAKAVGINDVYADSLPADKLAVIESLKHRPVVFVGDGVNDAPVLTAADVGIALGARGSTAASESADMVILQDDIGRVAVAYRIARRTFSIARQSIVVGIGLSLVLMAIFATGKFSPLTGAVLQEVVDVVVIFNALRALSEKY